MIKFIYVASPILHKRHYLLFSNDIKNICQKYNIQILLTFLPTRNLLRKLSISLSELSNYQNIVFIDTLEHKNLILLLKKTDCLLFLSEQESLGLPILEAVMNGIPVIAPNLSYATELLGSDYPYLFESSDMKNTRKSLIKIIIKFVDDFNSNQVKSHNKLNFKSIDDLVDLMFSKFKKNL